MRGAGVLVFLALLAALAGGAGVLAAVLTADAALRPVSRPPTLPAVAVVHPPEPLDAPLLRPGLQPAP
jgi:hypothetical protein